MGGPTTEALVLAAGVWGALTGALLPRAAYRFSAPHGEPWRDRCPAGAHPVRGWLGGDGCGECRRGARTGAREGSPRGTPSAAVLTLVTALVCAALAAATGARPEVGVWLLLAPAGVLLAAVDLRVRRLPDPLTLPFAAAALALLGLAALLPEHTGHWPTALCAAGALAAGHLVLHLLNPDGMGFGDVKLAAGTGAVLGWYGWSAVLLGTFAAFLLGALYGGALVLARRADRKTGVPFGPFLLAGTLAGLLTGAFAA
ncbi:A24 family peptidase [Streptomyces sp. NPDC038707]|uniref:A24 family peptidase n=1 Tax=Streptomyces sp. NPDC038707 TaxID=3154329 RepID=UPI003411300B